jgi:hypothetical protein
MKVKVSFSIHAAGEEISLNPHGLHLLLIVRYHSQFDHIFYYTDLALTC